MVELVVAMMVLSVVLVILAAVQISAISTITEARKMQQATAFANEAAEQMHSIPWNTLSKGMYSGFLAASGGDELVVGGDLRIPDNDPVPLKIATAGVNDQDRTKPARPLFTSTGSHKQTRTDPSLTGEFTIKAYVTNPSGAVRDGIVGIVVVVEWTDRHGGLARTTVWSEAYRGSATSCGKVETQPFLSACQSFFEASAGTGSVRVDISALSLPPDPADATVQPLMTPGFSNEYSLGLTTAGASARIQSQQVNYADANLQFGGNIWSDNDVSSAARTRGFFFDTRRATDDETNQSGWLAHVPPFTVTQGSGAEDEWAVSDDPASPITLRVRSDYARPGTMTASMTTECRPGIPAGQPCAHAKLTNVPVLESGSGYLWMYLKDDDGATTIFRLSRRLNDGLASNAGNFEEAWAARFVSASGSAAVGCTAAPTGAGCVSAGATRTMADFSIGSVATGKRSWDGAAGNGMAILKGDASCPAGQNTYYGESVMVQRGAAAGQNTVGPTYERCGKLEYWTGTGPTGYTTQPIRKTTSETLVTAPVTWTSADGVYTIVASTHVQITLPYLVNDPPADPKCQTDSCFVSVGAGSIIFVSTYHISWPGHEHLLIAVTTVTGPSALASYTAAPSGA